MFGSRSGRPSLIGSAARTAGRTAVVVKTANAVNNSAAAKQAARAPQAAAMAEAPPPPPAPAGGLSDEAIARLKQLSELHQAGILTEAEFAEQKARILAA
jgi:hypothetical protein